MKSFKHNLSFFTSSVLTRSNQPPKYFLNPYTLLQLNHFCPLVWPRLSLGQLTHVFVPTTWLISFHSPNNVLVKSKSEHITSLPKSLQPLIITCRIKPKPLAMALVALVAVLATFADSIASHLHLVESPGATRIAFFLFRKLSSLILPSELLPFLLHLMEIFCPQRPEFSLPQTLAHTVYLQWVWPSAIYMASSF